MKSNPGVSATFFKALAAADINVEMISTSEIRISIITRDDRLDDALRAVHTAFGLDAPRRPWSTGAPAADPADASAEQAHVIQAAWLLSVVHSGTRASQGFVVIQ
jgi:hypothetical protein